MIEFLCTWIEQIIIALTIVSILEMLLPNGNIKKYIKVVLSIYVIFSIISPFVDSKKLYNLSTDEFNSYIENTTINNNNLNQIDTSNTYENLYLQELEKDLKERIKQFGYTTKKCDIEAEFNKEKSNAGINKINLIISKNDSYIKDVNQIQKIEINKKEETIETNTSINNNETVKKIRKELSKIYEIDENIVYITEE